MTTDASSLTDRLRVETRPEHDRIEAALAIPDGIREPADYVRLLAGFHSFYQPLEQQLLLLDWTDSGIDVQARRKAPLLAQDLDACGVEPGSLVSCKELPRPQNRAEGLGCLYVLEGATLGGEIIHRRLHAHFGGWLEGRDRFYRCYGEERGRMWREFKRAADEFGERCAPASRDHTIEAARLTFRLLQAWLEPR